MEPARAPKVRIGDLLVSKGLIIDDQLKRALDEQKRTGKKIGKVVVDLGFVSESQLLQALAAHFSYPFVDMARFRLNNELIKTLPETYARRFRAIVLSEQPDGLLVGMGDPLDLLAMDELQRILRRPVHPAFVKEQELLDAMDRAYRRSEQIASIAVELDSELGTTDFDLDNLATTTDTAEAPVVRLLQSIFEDAV
ncbi:MAG: MSHA biogenesis protein MshE, partial [Pseudomonadota bacterium]